MRANKGLATYDCAARKVFLMPWQEAQGILQGVKRIAEAVFLTLAFNAEYVEIEIPISLLQTDLDDIREIIGGKVSILRTESRYLISSKPPRRVKKE